MTWIRSSYSLSLCLIRDRPNNPFEQNTKLPNVKKSARWWIDSVESDVIDRTIMIMNIQRKKKHKQVSTKPIRFSIFLWVTHNQPVNVHCALFTSFIHSLSFYFFLSFIHWLYFYIWIKRCLSSIVSHNDQSGIYFEWMIEDWVTRWIFSWSDLLLFLWRLDFEEMKIEELVN